MSLTTDLDGRPACRSRPATSRATRPSRRPGVRVAHLTSSTCRREERPPPLWAKPFASLAANPGEAVLKLSSSAWPLMRGAFLSDDEHGPAGASATATRSAKLRSLDLDRGQEPPAVLRHASTDQSAVGVWSDLRRSSPAGATTSAWRAGQGQVHGPDGAPEPRRHQRICRWRATARTAATGAGMLAARAGWQTVEIEATVVGLVHGRQRRPVGADGQLHALQRRWRFPGGANKMTLGTQAITFAQDDRPAARPRR